MNKRLRRWAMLSGVGCVLLLWACSAEQPSTAGRSGGGPTGTGGPGAGGHGATGDIGDISNPGGVVSTASGGGGSGSAPQVLPVDPNAAAYVQDDTAMGGLDADTVKQLQAGGGACAVTVTYPYDDTVFPGGLTPPTIMWDGGGDAAYVHFAYQSSDKLDYAYAASVSEPAQLQIPRQAWNEITRRTNNYPLEVTLNVRTGNSVSSCKLRWKIAPGNMVGAIYYNTYQAPAPGVMGQGAVMRQTLGNTAEIYKQYTDTLNVIPDTGPCISCHSVSFNGSTMVASYHDYSMQVFRVEKYDIQATTQPTASGTLDNANFGALTPDGSRILAMGNPQCTAGADSFPRKPNNFPLVEGPAIARMLDTSTGQDTQAAGLNPDYYMWMPQFSPDGTKVVFNHAKSDGMGGTDRRELAIMDYDEGTNTFSNLKVIVPADKLPGVSSPSLDYSPTPALAGVLACGAEMCGEDGMPNTCTDSGGVPVINNIPGIPGDTAALPGGSCDGPCYPAWPFFTPDNKAVVFVMTSEPDFAQAFPGRDAPARSELWYVDLDTLQTVRLDNANTGLKDSDKLSNYYPTVMPVAVGGYFWVFWTSTRDYGNKLQGQDPNAPTTAALDAIRKRIWGAAIKPKQQTAEFADTTLTDPSFPGFYLDGQSESGNVRAFAALNPCLQNGASCTSGLDCCCGYCTDASGSQTGTCTCDMPMCAKLNEKCKTTADCCPAETPDDPTPTCIAGYCSFIHLD